MWWLNMHVHCKIITMVRLVNTPFTSQSYCFMVVVRKFKIYCPSDFHVPNAVLLTIVSLLGVNPQGGFILSLEVRIFCVFCILMLCSWSLADLSGTVPPQVSQSPKTVNNSPSAFQKPHLSEANQPLQSPHPEPPILLGSQKNHQFYWVLKLSATIPCPQYPRGYQTTWDSPMPQGLLKSFKPANPKPVSPAVPGPSQGGHIKALARIFPLPPLPPHQPWCFPGWPLWGGVPLPLGNYEYQTIFPMAIISSSVSLAIPKIITKPIFYNSRE